MGAFLARIAATLYLSGHSFERVVSAIEKKSGGVFEEQAKSGRRYLLRITFYCGVFVAGHKYEWRTTRVR
ncbi:hypothetical protein [Kosakonia sacchari]|uniref:Uncharacterized protein n=1 Tax=Kosakonia sacchari TaxID=1158459 RepID=A0ABZ0MWG3_9ENTR|nr:hypothetical protein [Kosakonia sacchari]WOZ79885.1 hypothetical protein Q8Y70_15625 [Kosakonia sacchari]